MTPWHIVTLWKGRDFSNHGTIMESCRLSCAIRSWDHELNPHVIESYDLIPQLNLRLNPRLFHDWVAEWGGEIRWKVDWVRDIVSSWHWDDGMHRGCGIQMFCRSRSWYLDGNCGLIRAWRINPQLWMNSIEQIIVDWVRDIETTVRR